MITSRAEARKPGTEARKAVAESGRAGTLICALLLSGCASVAPLPMATADPHPSAAFTLPEGAEVLDMARTLRIALRNNPGLQAEYRELDIAAADLTQAGLIDNPVLGLEYLTGGDGHMVTAAVLQPLMSLVTLKARRQLGAVQAEIRTQQVRHAVQELTATVKSAYAQAIAEARLAELADQAVIAAEAAAELAARQYSAGTASRRDQAQQQAAYAQWSLESAQTHARLDERREHLNRLLGLWGRHTAWTLPAATLDLPEKAVDAPDAESRAVAARADLAAALKDTEARYRQLGLSRDTRWLHGLGLGFVFERDSDGARQRGPHVELGLPLFDRGQGSVARAQAELARSERQLEALAIAVRSQAREASARVRASHAAALHLRRALLPLHAIIVAETQKLYNGMLVGIYDLLLARQQQLMAARQAIEATRDYWLAVAELERVTGGALPAGGMPSPLARAGEDVPPAGGGDHPPAGGGDHPPAGGGDHLTASGNDHAGATGSHSSGGRDAAGSEANPLPRAAGNSPGDPAHPHHGDKP